MSALVTTLQSVVIPPLCLQIAKSLSYVPLFKWNFTLFLCGDAVPNTPALRSSRIESQCHLFTGLFKSTEWKLVVLFHNLSWIVFLHVQFSLGFPQSLLLFHTLCTIAMGRYCSLYFFALYLCPIEVLIYFEWIHGSLCFELHSYTQTNPASVCLWQPCFLNTVLLHVP